MRKKCNEVGRNIEKAHLLMQHSACWKTRKHGVTMYSWVFWLQLKRKNLHLLPAAFQKKQTESHSQECNPVRCQKNINRSVPRARFGNVVIAAEFTVIIHRTCDTSILAYPLSSCKPAPDLDWVQECVNHHRLKSMVCEQTPLYWVSEPQFA